jgi:tetratricopeptide (TPR) repeat protein
VNANNSGRRREADAHAQRAQRLFEQHGQPHSVLFGLMSQGRHARVRGRPDQALAYFERAEAIRGQSFADNAALATDLDQERATALLALGRVDEARSLLQRISPEAIAQLPADRARNAVWLEATRARLAAVDGDPHRMQLAIDAALDGYAATPGQNDLEHGWLLSDLGQAALAAAQDARARALFAQALEHLAADSSGVHWAIAWAGHRLAGAAPDPGRDAQARALLEDEGIATPLALAFLRR